MEGLGWVVTLPATLVGLGAAVAYATTRSEPGSGDRLRRQRREQPFAHELPYWSFIDAEDGCIGVNVDLTYSAFLELRGIDTDCLDDAKLALVSGGIHSSLQNLPAGTLLQFLHWTDADVTDVVGRYAQTTGTTALGAAIIAAKAQDVLGNSSLRRSRLILVLSAPNQAQSAKARAAGLVRRFPTLSATHHEEAVRRLSHLRDQISRALDAAGLSATSMASSDVKRIAYEFLNPHRMTIVPDPFAEHDHHPHQGWIPEQSARARRDRARARLHRLQAVHYDPLA
jgi:hypothetical protein